jgi:hypothetical protein
MNYILKENKKKSVKRTKKEREQRESQKSIYCYYLIGEQHTFTNFIFLKTLKKIKQKLKKNKKKT